MLAQLLPLPGLPPLLEIIALLILLIIGLLILVLIVKVIFLFLPAAIIALVVWFLTGSWFWAGVAFLVIAVISITRRK
jgi:hypothetical protein